MLRGLGRSKIGVFKGFLHGEKMGISEKTEDRLFFREESIQIGRGKKERHNDFSGTQWKKTLKARAKRSGIEVLR